MKLRNRLSLLLVTSMITTGIPLPTMAASTNSLNKFVPIIEGSILDTTTGMALYIQFDAVPENTSTTFFLDANDFDFTESAYKNEDGTDKIPGVTFIFKDQLRVVSPVTSEGNIISIPIMGTIKGGFPNITVDSFNSLVTSGRYFLGEPELVFPSLRATVGTRTVLSKNTSGSIADITITELAEQQLNEQEITITLNKSSNLLFDYKLGDKVIFEGKRAFYGLEDTDTAFVEVKAVEDSSITLNFSGFNVNKNTTGSVILKNLKVIPDHSIQNNHSGDITATITSNNMVETSFIVANVVNMPVTIHNQNSQIFSVNGAIKPIQIWFEEHVKDTFPNELFISINKGKIYNYDIPNTFSSEIIGSEIKITNLENTFSGLTINMQVQALKKGDIKIIARSNGWEYPLEISIGEAISNSITTEDNSSGNSSNTSSNSNSNNNSSVSTKLSLSEKFNTLPNVAKAVIRENLEKLPYTTLSIITDKTLNEITLNKLDKYQLEELKQLLHIETVILEPLKTSLLDIEHHWAKDSIEYITSLGLASGYNGYFMPEDTLTLADTLTFLNRLLLINNLNTNTLPRSIVESYYLVPDNHWSYSNVYNLCAKLEEKTVKQLENFNGREVNRGLLAQILMELTDDLNLSVVYENHEPFKDIRNTPYSSAIKYCYEHGLLSGYNGLYRPNDSLTRAEMSKVLTILQSKLHNLIP